MFLHQQQNISNNKMTNTNYKQAQQNWDNCEPEDGYNPFDDCDIDDDQESDFDDEAWIAGIY